jgi:putative salt-induced outer membrane protein YdiY
MSSRILSLTLCAAALAAPLSAQTPADSLGWHFVGNLGYVQTSGNTKLSTVNLGDKAVYRASASWTFTQTAGLVYGKSAGVQSANQLLAGLRADYWITPRLSAFGSADYEANPFAGISHRMQELGGLSWKAIATPRRTLSIDLGAGVTQERTGGVDQSYGIARLAPTFRQLLGAHAYIEEGLELTEDLKHTGRLRTVSNTSLVAPLTSAIGIRVSYLMRYDAEPAVAGLKKLDTTFTTGIQVSL